MLQPPPEPKPKLHTMWREAITNRVRESQQITAELDLLSHAIVEYLRDATDIDLENAGLILDVLPDEGPEWV